MKWLYNLSTRAKLILGFGTCLVLMVAMGLFSILRLGQLDAIAEKISEDPLPGGIAMGVVATKMRDVHTYGFNHILSVGQPAALQDIETALRKTEGEIDEQLKEYEATIHFEEDRQNFNQLKQSWQRYLQLHSKLIELDRQGKGQQAETLMNGQMKDLFLGEIAPLLSKMMAWNQDYGKKLSAQTERTYRQSRLYIMGVLLVAVFAGAFLGWFISR